MFIYFFLIRIAALLGHEKARKLVKGQAATLRRAEREWSALRGAIWIHAASVGEFEQARPIIEKLRAEKPQRKIVITFFSPSGYEMRKNYDLADAVLYLPFATRRNVKRFIEALQPSMALFVKYEFWPAYLRELKKRKIRTYSISAIFRPKQLFFRPWGKTQLRLLNCFTHIFVQDTESENLLKAHGINHCSVAGDTRFDRVKEIMELQKTKADNRLTPVAQFVQGCDRVIIAGSTWPKDEQLLEQYMSQLQCQMANGQAKLILVPHEIDEVHLHFIFKLFQGRMVRYSYVVNNTELTPESRQNILYHAQVLLIDTMGLLSSLYQFGQVAYVGGGFGVGIHNTIEAAVYGLPVIFGPNYLHFREAIGLIEAGAARSIKNYQELEQALNTALDQHAFIGAKASAYVESELGATSKIYREIFEK